MKIPKSQRNIVSWSSLYAQNVLREGGGVRHHSVCPNNTIRCESKQSDSYLIVAFNIEMHIKAESVYISRKVYEYSTTQIIRQNVESAVFLVLYSYSSSSQQPIQEHCNR